MSTGTGLERLVRHVRRRQHVATIRRVLRVALAAAASVLAALALLRLSSLVGTQQPAPPLLIGGAALVAAFLVALTLAAKRRLPRASPRGGKGLYEEARLVDRLLGADSLLLTACEIRRRGAPADPMQGLVLQQAEAALNGWRKRASALRLEPTPGSLLAPTLALTAAATFLVATFQGSAPPATSHWPGASSPVPPAPVAFSELRKAIARAAERTPGAPGEELTDAPSAVPGTPWEQGRHSRPEAAHAPARDADVIAGSAQRLESGETPGRPVPVPIASATGDGTGTKAVPHGRDDTPLRRLDPGGSAIPLPRSDSRVRAGPMEPAPEPQQSPTLATSPGTAVTTAEALPPIPALPGTGVAATELSLHRRLILARYHRHLRAAHLSSDPGGR
jgi:hypothetical protein